MPVAEAADIVALLNNRYSKKLAEIKAAEPQPAKE